MWIFCESKDVFNFHFQVDLSVSGLEKIIGARQALSLFQVRHLIWFDCLVVWWSLSYNINESLQRHLRLPGFWFDCLSVYNCHAPFPIISLQKDSLQKHLFYHISIGNVVEEIRPGRVMFGLIKYAVWSKKTLNHVSRVPDNLITSFDHQPHLKCGQTQTHSIVSVFFSNSGGQNVFIKSVTKYGNSQMGWGPPFGNLNWAM